MTDFTTLRQHQLLSQLLGLARAQARALVDDRLDIFLSLMDERERIVAELVALEETPAPANVLPFPTIAPRRGDPDAKDALRGLIRSILSQDDANEHTLRLQMDDLRGTLDRINHGITAGRGYAATLTRPRAGVGLDRAC